MTILYGFLLLSSGIFIGFGLAALFSANGRDDDIHTRCPDCLRRFPVGSFYPPGTRAGSDRKEDAGKILEDDGWMR